MKVAIISTHPIQYHTPWFCELAQQNIELKVYYALLPDQQQQAVGFGDAFAWDIPLLEGYDWELLPNKRESPAVTGFFRSSTPAIYSRLADSKPDVVIITGWQSLPLLQALWAAFRLGIPRIVRGESNGLRRRPLPVRGFHRLLFSLFDAFLAIGKLNRQFYLDYDIPSEKIFSAPYFVDNQRFMHQFRQDVRERPALRVGWNIDGGPGEDGERGRPGEGETGRRGELERETASGRQSPFVSRPSVGGPPSAVDRRTCFLFAGKLEPKKRIIDLLRAMDLAREPEERRTTSDGRPPLVRRRSSLPGRPSIHLLVVGTGELMEEARQFAESRGLPVTFAGFLNQTEITRAYAAADCLVLPSDYGETWGLVVNEAMACGLPAIVSDRVGCAPDVVEEGVTGGVFPCGDINALAQKLQAFASDPAKLARMAEQARQRISDYSAGNAVAGTMRAIEFVTSDGRRATDDGLSGHLSQIARRPSPVCGLRSSLRVLHVIPSLSPGDGGPSFAMPLMARGLELSGVQVDVATTEGDREQRINQNGVSVLYFPRQSEFYKVSLPLSRWLSEHIRDYDLVHIHALFSYSSYAAARLATKNGVPYIVRPLGVLNRWGMQNRRKLLKRFSFHFIEQRIMRNAAAIHYTSQQERLEAAETGVRNESVVIPLAVDLSGFRELPGPEPFHQKFPDARGREIILFLSRLDPKKGLDLLLRAFAACDGRRMTDDGRRMTEDGRPVTGDGRRMTEDGRPVTGDGRRITEDGRPSSVVRRPSSSVVGPLLVIAGDGNDQFVEGLRRLAGELGIADEILWSGFLGGDDKLSAMAAASVFVLPSYSENFGIALAEAMAAGLPCVLSDQVGIAVDANGYDAGLVVPCEVGPLASAMQRLLDDPELRGRLGANARRLVDDRFSVEAMSASLVKLYERVLSRDTGDRRPETDDRRPETGQVTVDGRRRTGDGSAPVVRRRSSAVHRP